MIAGNCLARDERTGNRRPPRILILLPMVWSIRNVINSGVFRRLCENGLEVHLVLRHLPPKMLGAAQDIYGCAKSVQPFAAVQPTGRDRGRLLVKEILYAAYNRRNRIRSFPIYRKWLSRGQSRRARLRSSVADILSYAATPTFVFKYVQGYYRQMYLRGFDLGAVREHLRTVAPDLVWSTINVAGEEAPYVAAARELGIPVVTSILSFDNLSSRRVDAIYDHYMVWSAAMRDQLLRFLPEVGPSQVSITGTPQFDFHRIGDYCWSRARTVSEMTLPPDVRYFVYAASAEQLTKQEPILLRQISERLSGDAVLKDHWLVVRLHPLDDPERWDGLKRHGSRIVVSEAWTSKPAADGWAWLTSTDLSRLVSTLAHADGCINIASTMALDAAIMGRPVIGVDFRGKKGCPQEILYEEYETEHYRPLVESGGIRVAHDWDELLGLMRCAFQVPEKDRENRLRMVERECGRVDGHAGDRLVEALLRFARTPHRDRAGAAAGK